jgi:hypothetical protein
MKTYGGYGVIAARILDGVEWSDWRSSRFTPGTHWNGSWLGPKAGLDVSEKVAISCSC